jgi:hypothetical protein
MKARPTLAAARLLRQRLATLVLAAGVAVALVVGLGGLAQARTIGLVNDAGRAGSVTLARTQASAPPVLEVQSCTGSSFCLATGSYSKPGHPYIPVLERWNGKAWRIIPDPSGFEGQITCGGPSFCLAVVSAPKDSARDVVWNGRAWRAFKPQPPDAGDVSCVSATFCVTLNSSQYPSEYVGWNGKTWQDMTQDSGGCGGAWCTYNHPTCASATDCSDSGTYCQDSDCDGGLIYFSDTWNGTTWNQSHENGPGFGGSTACAGRSFCLVLDPPNAAITNDWGNSWHSATANLTTACHHLASCALPADPACGSPHFCLALPSANPTASLVWNGAKWGVKALALVSRHLPDLTNLACGSPRNCVATGTYQITPRSAPRPVAEHWNGKSWQVTPVVIP